MKLEDAIKTAKDFLGQEIFDSIDIDFEMLKESDYNIELVLNKNKATLKYRHLCDLFRGLSLIKENKGKDSFEAKLKSSFSKKALFIDCSRNAAVRISELKKIILIQALMGQNQLYLYLEDGFKLDNYPYFGYLRPSYSEDELKCLDEYASSFGIELIPAIQTLGHLKKVLRWSQMSPISDTDDTLLINNPNTYVFVEELIKFCKKCFKTHNIHIGMDESVGIGLGKYLNDHSYKDPKELFIEHLQKVSSLCKKYDLKPLIWSDMYFRLMNNGDYLTKNPNINQNMFIEIPNNVLLVYWDYYHKDQKFYDNMIKLHKSFNDNICFAGAAWRWIGFAPSIESSFVTNIPALKSCLKNKIDNVILTTWGDNGNECSIYSIIASIALYSTFDYYQGCKYNKVDSLLSAVTGETIKRLKIMDKINKPQGIMPLPEYNPSKYFFYQDVILGLFDYEVKEGYSLFYKKLAKSLFKASKESKNFGYMYKTLCLFSRVLEVKIELGTDIRKAYKAGDKEKLNYYANRQIPLLLNNLKKFNDALYEQWNKENTPFGYDVLDGRIGYLKNRIIYCQKVINEYLNHKIDIIDELEQEILPFDDRKDDVCWNSWLNTVSVNGL